MRFSTKSRYALRLMIELATTGSEQFMALKDISKKQEISVKYLEHIVNQLTRASLVISSRGPQGGYKLAKKASEYTPGEIIRAIEGNLAPVACLATKPNSCPRCEQCTTINFWSGLHQVMDQYLDSMTLQDLAENTPSAHGCYCA